MNLLDEARAASPRLGRRADAIARLCRLLKREVLAEQAKATAPRSAGSELYRRRQFARLVRQWAAENGHEINDHGRLPVKVVSAYLNQHPEVRP